MLPAEANSTDYKNNVTLQLQKSRQLTTYCNASASIFYLKAGTTAPKPLTLGIYRNIYIPGIIPPRGYGNGGVKKGWLALV